jgi:hypothetical protein
MTLTTAVPVLLVMLAVTSAAPQVRVVRYGDDRLTGITEVDVLITTQPAAGCDVGVPASQQTAADALAAANVRATQSITARSWHYSVVVDVRSGRSGTSCASSVTTELVAEVAGAPEADALLPPGAWGSLLMGYMTLARESTLVIAPPLEHDAAVRAVIGDHVTAIAMRLRSANK